MEPGQSSVIVQTITAILSLLACGLFSFMETSITALRIFNLKELAKKTKRYHRLLEVLENEPQRVLIAILIGNCLVNVIAADSITTVVEYLLQQYHISPGLRFFGAIGSATILMLIFGDIIPKNLAQARFNRLFESTLWIANIVFYVMAPLVYIFSHLTRFVITSVRNPSDSNPDEEGMISEQEIQFLIDYIDKKGKMESDKSRMLNSIFELAHTLVQDIMVPEANMACLDVSLSMEDALDFFVRYSYSRIPVYEGNVVNIIGMLHQKDIILAITSKYETTLRNLVRPILFVPETMHVNALLRQLKEQRQHIAIVTGEQDAIVGLVTLEDAIEEIVGDINDEHESVAQYITEFGDGGWLVYGGVDLCALEKLLGISFEIKRATTLADFLMEYFGEIPKKGEELSYKDYNFKVEKTTQKRIVHILIFKHAI